jgi:hypothetical protein
MSAPCPQCGGSQFRLETAMPLTITGKESATINMPIYSTNPKQTKLEIIGHVSVSSEKEKTAYRFAYFKKIRREIGKNWVQIKPRRDKTGLDIVFGRRPGGEVHSHYSYTAKPKMIYFRSDDTRLARELVFDGNAGAFVPLNDRIYDQKTKTSLILQFALQDQEIVITQAQLIPMPIL